MKEKCRKRWGVFIWGILAVLSLAYFFLLLGFCGFTNKFFLIWPFFSCCCMAMAIQCRLHVVEKWFPGWLIRFGKTVLLLMLVLFLGVEGLICTGFYAEPEEGVYYVVVLGAHVKNGRPSIVLQKRLDTAIAYAGKYPNCIIIASGGQGGNESEAEAVVMARYLEEKGIAADRIRVEDQSRNTKENLQFSMKFIERENAATAIVSNDFHIFRATHIAKKAGYVNPQGLAARDDARTILADMVREFFGVVKDFACGNMIL